MDPFSQHLSLDILGFAFSLIPSFQLILAAIEVSYHHLFLFTTPMFATIFSTITIFVCMIKHVYFFFLKS